MKISTLICEYDPFHNGHEYMLRQMRISGSDCIIACMSGNFTQRGEPAVIDKHTRQKAAINGGADLVLELPSVYACAGAERFAFGGVYILNSLGIADEIFFGSECGDIKLLESAALAADDSRVRNNLKEYLSQGMTFAAARESAVKDVFGQEVSDILRSPNNILAVEYIKALKKTGSHIRPCTIKRFGAGHNSMNTNNNTASASLIRDILKKQGDCRRFMPEYMNSAIESSSFTKDPDRKYQSFEKAVLYRLRMMSKEEFSCLPDMSEGLENRIFKASRNAESLEQLLSDAKCKRYTMSRIRRGVIHAFLGFNKEDFRISPQYIRVLGFNDKGQAALRMMKKSAALPIVTRHADTSKLTSEGKHLYELERRCDDLFSLFFEH